MIREHVFIAPSGGSQFYRLLAYHYNSAHAYTSGVQKERMQPEDIFVLLRSTRAQLRRPEKPLKQSACTPLFFNAYEQRDAGACIHTHSQHAVLATLLWPGKEWRISHQEMIKGMRIAGMRTVLSCSSFSNNLFR